MSQIKKKHMSIFQETTAKLKMLRNKLQVLQMKQSLTSDKLEECQRELTDKKGQLHSAPSAGISQGEPAVSQKVAKSGKTKK